MDQLFVRRVSRPAASISSAGLARPRRCMMVHSTPHLSSRVVAQSTIIECPPLLTLTRESTVDVDNKYWPDIKWPTKVKPNHPRSLDTRSARRTNSNKTAPGARYEIALNYAQLTRVIFHYYDSILASHNRAGVVSRRVAVAVSWDHSSSITRCSIFSPSWPLPLCGVSWEIKS